MVCRLAFRACLAGVLALGVVSAAAPARAADVKISDSARKHFNAGVALLRDPDGARYEEAYGEFKVAYEASPSWKILGNLGIAAMKLERDGEAIDAFTRYLAEGKKDVDAAERADIERDLGTLRAAAVSLMLTTTPAEVKITDQRSPVQGTPVVNRYDSQAGQLRLQIRPGHHVIVASLGDKPPLRFEFDATPGSTQQHDFNFDAAEPTGAVSTPAPAAPPPTSPAPVPPASGRPVPTGVWIGVAATGVFAAGAAVTGVMALGKNSDYRNANGHDAVLAKGLQSDTQTLNLVTDVLISAAVVSAGVTTFLYLRRPEHETTGLRIQVSPSVGLHQTGLNLQGTF